MTYDYRASGEADVSGQGTGVPNSPLSWVRECVRALAPDGMGREVRDMVLLGLPFYGEDVDMVAREICTTPCSFFLCSVRKTRQATQPP